MFSKKNKLPDSRTYIYAVYDKYTHNFVAFHTAISDGMASRYFLSSLRFPIRDTQLIRIGSFVKEDVKIKDNECIPTEFNNKTFIPEFNSVSWESYKFPETVAEALAPLNLSASEISEISRNKINSLTEVNNE